MLHNQVVAIAGAAGCIGAAFSRAVVSHGGRVVLGDIDKTRGRDLEKEFGSEQAVFCSADTSDPTSIDHFLQAGMERYGSVDAAVHCAYPRSSQWGTRFEDLKPEGLAEDLYCQLGGAILFSQRVIRHFRAQGHGTLVHVSSIQGIAAPKFEHYEGTTMVSPIEYSAIKAGIIAITRYLAKYCKGQNIRVNCLSPGGILGNQPQPFQDRYHQSCTSKGMLDACDLAGALIFLLSDQSKYMSGQNVVVDDGWSL